MAIKEFRMAWPDFVGGLMSYWGARLDSDGAWRLPNGLGVSLAPRPFDPHVEHDWYRWQLPGLGGATRGRLIDRNAQFVVRSPDGHWFWCSPLGGGRMVRMGVWQLLDKVAEHAVHRGAPCGWPVAGIVRTGGDAA